MLPYFVTKRITAIQPNKKICYFYVPCQDVESKLVTLEVNSRNWNTFHCSECSLIGLRKAHAVNK